MALFLANKHVLLGVTGSIAAYKSADLVRRLREVGAIVRVAMTENAKRFITPLTMQAVSGYPVHEELFDMQAEAAMGHIELARWADVILVAPASADFMARLAHGTANDLLTAVCLASNAHIAIAPAMNQGMWRNAFTDENRKQLQAKNIHILGPGEGSQACGDVGPGRMLEPAYIVEKVSDLFSTSALSRVRILMTAGPTHEYIDPVRYITNGSSGKMGYALAEAAYEAGANVTLVSGPVSFAPPSNIEVISVVSAQEMYDAVMRNVAECDIFLAVAAVSDYRQEHVATQKIHKQEARMTLQLTQNQDIVQSVASLNKPPFIVGFAAETENVIANAKAKRVRKKMNMIVANEVGNNIGMGANENAVTIISDHEEQSLPLMTKHKLARQLIQLIAKEFNQREHS